MEIFKFMKKIFFLAISILLINQYSFSQDINWKLEDNKFYTAEYDLSPRGSNLPSPVVLLKFPAGQFDFKIIASSKFGLKKTDLVTLSKKTGAVAGINTNFFDTKGDALGLVIDEGMPVVKEHKGGALMNALFLVGKDRTLQIINKDSLSKIIKLEDVLSAVQAGPRIIQNKQLVDISPQAPSRRSGLALTSVGDVIIFATKMRFPGATFGQLQRLLLKEELDVKDAMMFDGGGSSQLYYEKSSDGYKSAPTFITGGDLVPVGLVVKARDNAKQ